MKNIFLLISILLSIGAFGQSVGFLRYDSVVIMKQGGTAELVIRGKTRDTLGFLYNTGNGVTQFRRIRQINDTTIVAGRDTIVIKSAASGASGLSVLNGLGAGTQTLANGSSGTAPNWVSVGSAHTLHIPLASANGVTAGLISKSQYDALAKYSQLDSALNLYLLKADTMSLSNRINGRQIAGNYITGLNGDVLATGPGLSNAVLAPTSVTPGTYLNPTIIVDQKGRITSATSGSGGGTGTDNVNAGSGYRLVYPSQLIRTLYAGVGLTIDSTSNSQALTFKPDTSYLATQSDLAGLGTVKSVATGYGLSGGTITSSGTLIVDSAALAGKFLRREDSAIYATTTRADSLVGAVASKLSNISGLVAPGTGMTRTGLGTSGSPYIFNASNNGTVTNVSSGYGLLGGPITSTGTLRVDTAALRVLFGSSGGGGTPAGSTYDIQYKDGGFGANGKFNANPMTGVLTSDNFTINYNSSLSKKITFAANHSSVAPGALWYTEHNVNDDGTYNNVLSGGLNFDNTKAGYGYIRWGLEGNYQPFPGAPYRWFEAHLPEVSLIDGTTYRPASWEGRKDARSGSWAWRASSYNFFRATSDLPLLTFNQNGNYVMRGYSGGAQLTLTDSVGDFQTNISGTDAFLTASNNLGNIYLRSNVTLIPNLNNSQYPFQIFTNGRTGARGLFHSGSVGSDNGLIFDGQVSAGGTYYGSITNTGTGSAGLFLTTQTGGGIPLIQLNHGVQNWTLGNSGGTVFHNYGDSSYLDIRGSDGRIKIGGIYNDGSGAAKYLTVNNGVVGVTTSGGGGGTSSQWTDISGGGIYYNNPVVVGGTSFSGGRTFTVNAASLPLIALNQGGTEKGLFGVSNGASSIITGSINGDLTFRGSQSLLMAADNGNMSLLRLGSDNNASLTANNFELNGNTSGTISGKILNSGSGAARTYISNATGGLDIQVNGAGLATVSSNLGLTLSANSGSTLTLASGSTSLSATGQTITMPGLAGVGNRTVTANASGVLSPSETVYQTYTSTSTNNTPADMAGLMTVSDREAGVFEVTVYASSGTAKYVHKVITGFVATATTINFDAPTDVLPETTTGALAGASWDLAYDANGDLKINRTGVTGQTMTWRVEVKKYGVIAP